MVYVSFAKKMKELGFHAVADRIPYRLFICDISPKTMLVVEGFHDGKNPEYKYTFYTMRCGTSRYYTASYRVHADNVSALKLLRRVRYHMDYLENTKK
ncbi:hypothetical protein D9N27_09290 [Listeria monocytogenes]|nr:hypothetical protein [Listeria monocytogenes]